MNESLGDRTKYLGASDMAAVCGVDPYRNAYDVWLEKTGQLDDKPPNRAMELGIRLEPVVLQWAEEQIGLIDSDIEAITILDSPIMVHPDGVHRETGRPVESKTAGMGWKVSDEWGEAGSDQVPEQYIVQCQTQMLALHADLCYLPAFLGGTEFRMYHIKFDPEMAEHILQIARDFWTVHVERMEPPDDEPHVEFNKRRRRKPISVPIDNSLLSEYLEAQDMKKSACKRYDEMYNEVIGFLSDAGAEEGVCGETKVTYKKQKRKTLKRDPDNGTILCSESESEFPVLRVKIVKENPNE